MAQAIFSGKESIGRITLEKFKNSHKASFFYPNTDNYKLSAKDYKIGPLHGIQGRY
jgi:hypothetical protein